MCYSLLQLTFKLLCKWIQLKMIIFLEHEIFPILLFSAI